MYSSYRTQVCLMTSAHDLCPHTIKRQTYSLWCKGLKSHFNQTKTDRNVYSLLSFLSSWQVILRGKASPSAFQQTSMFMLLRYHSNILMTSLFDRQSTLQCSMEWVNFVEPLAHSTKQFSGGAGALQW